MTEKHHECKWSLIFSHLEAAHLALHQPGARRRVAVFGRLGAQVTDRSPYAGEMERCRIGLFFVVLIAPLPVWPQTAPAPEGSAVRARQLIEQLHLSVLPKESGYLGIIGDSAQKVPVNGRLLKVQSQVYYMLTREQPINYLHWLEPDDTHILIEGGPVDYFLFHLDGRVEKVVLGRDIAAGQRPVVAVPGGCWKALRLHKGAEYALMANALSPEWTPDRVRIGEGESWLKRFAGKAEWATPEELRALIGPNWKP
jgi:predicted cupin superfamily sugar epimerase